MHLPAGWYVVAEASELKINQPNALRRFGVDWVVWRTSQGQWVLQKDLCPHRSAKLSLGKIESDCLVCPFHGFRFDSAGSCVHVPEIDRPAPGLGVQVRKLTLFKDFLWVNIGVPESTPMPWFDDLPGDCWGSRYQVNWEQHFSRCVENQLDHCHVPFVHSTTIGRGQKPQRAAHTEVTGDGITVSMGSAPGQGTNFKFLFPGIWRLKVQGKLMPFLAFVPIDADNTRIYMRTYQSFVTIAGLRELTGWLLDQSNRVILKQDHRVVIDQRPKDVRQAHDEKLFPGDAAIRAFRDWLGRDLIDVSV